MGSLNASHDILKLLPANSLSCFSRTTWSCELRFPQSLCQSSSNPPSLGVCLSPITCHTAPLLPHTFCALHSSLLNLPPRLAP